MNVPNEAWVPANPDYTCGTLCRSGNHLIQVCQQFSVETAARYQPQKDGTGKIVRTFCNIYAADVLQALSVPAPLHWWMSTELRANDLTAWFAKHGPTYGWSVTDELAARAAATAGRPTIAIYTASVGDGHVAIILPSDPAGPTMVAAAGASCFCNGPLGNSFGGVHPIVFWTRA